MMMPKGNDLRERALERAFQAITSPFGALEPPLITTRKQKS